MALDSMIGQGLTKSPYQEKCEEIEQLKEEIYRLNRELNEQWWELEELKR